MMTYPTLDVARNQTSNIDSDRLDNVNRNRMGKYVNAHCVVDKQICHQLCELQNRIEQCQGNMKNVSAMQMGAVRLQMSRATIFSAH